jgi:basic amino acid/polyamine antiporter, APA family
MGLVQTTIQLLGVQKGKLLRILGRSFGIAVTVGGMIGVGILLTPGIVAAYLGESRLVIAVWTLGGFYALLGAISIAEVGIALPRTGGWYVYARRAFGDYAGFAVGWSSWLSYCTGGAIGALAIGTEIAKLLSLPANGVRAASLITFLAVSFLNALGLRPGSRFQEVSSFVKVAAFLIFVLACFVVQDRQPSPLSQTAVNSPATSRAFFYALMFALQSVVYAYDSWYNPIYFAEEDRHPTRNLIPSMVIAILLVMAIYLLVNLGLIHVLTLPDLATSSSPVSDAAQNIFGPYGGKIIKLLAIVALLSLLNAGVMIAPRLLFAMSRDGLFTGVGTIVSKGGTPVIGLFVTAIATLPLILTNKLQRLLSVTSFLFVLVYASGFLAVLVLRVKEPELPRPYRIWGYPWPPMIVLFISAIFLIGQVISNTKDCVFALILIACSYPAFLIVRRRTRP